MFWKDKVSVSDGSMMGKCYFSENGNTKNIGFKSFADHRLKSKCSLRERIKV